MSLILPAAAIEKLITLFDSWFMITPIKLPILFLCILIVAFETGCDFPEIAI